MFKKYIKTNIVSRKVEGKEIKQSRKRLKSNVNLVQMIKSMKETKYLN